jgi:uncharacterized protein YacL
MNIGLKIALTGVIMSMISVGVIAYVANTYQNLSDTLKIICMLNLIGGVGSTVVGLLIGIWMP